MVETNNADVGWVDGNQEVTLTMPDDDWEGGPQEAVSLDWKDRHPMNEPLGSVSDGGLSFSLAYLRVGGFSYPRVVHGVQSFSAARLWLAGGLHTRAAQRGEEV